MITAIILTKNEEKNIIDCIESVSFCDEIIVIDDNSNDRTVEIARLKGANVIENALENNFSQQRNFALNLSKNNWVLFVDADERVSHELSTEIIRKVSENKKDGYYIKRVDKLFGRELRFGELSQKKFLRLAKKGKGKWKRKVHEVWEISGRVGTLHNSLLHFPHQTISEFLQEINFYSSIRAEELYKNGTRTNWFSIILYTKGKFFYTYVLKLGFLDGIPGIIVSLMMTMYTYLVRSKLYLLTHKRP